jgi:hypothetical protein
MVGSQTTSIKFSLEVIDELNYGWLKGLLVPSISVRIHFIQTESNLSNLNSLSLDLLLSNVQIIHWKWWFLL